VIEVFVPKWGLTIDSVRIARKLHADGEIIEDGEPICEVETDKSTMEIEATGTGILTWAVNEGDEVPVGDVVARIEAS
jgi:2-oxoglutarate dehydrogenase E2 component (dihydrolipoamide succinyltransferase)